MFEIACFARSVFKKKNSTPNKECVAKKPVQHVPAQRKFSKSVVVRNRLNSRDKRTSRNNL
jgi:hypothetical protein